MDGWRWLPCIDGLYSVRWMSAAIDAIRAEVSDISTIWSPLLPSKVNVFIWRMHKGFIPCYLHLAMRSIPLQSVCCPICNWTFKDVNHAILRCTKPAAIWSSILAWCGLPDLFYGRLMIYFLKIYWERCRRLHVQFYT